MKKKKERKCPCGSKLILSQCCLNPKPGNTPEEVKGKITKIIIETFDYIGDTRGETCLYVAKLTKESLTHYGIKSYIVAGSSKWDNVVTFYKWNPPREFHAWTVTEYGEIVDLACDALYERVDMRYKQKMHSPTRCWDQELNDREYIPGDIGALSFEIDRKGYDSIREIGLRLLKTELESEITTKDS